MRASAHRCDMRTNVVRIFLLLLLFLHATKSFNMKPYLRTFQNVFKVSKDALSTKSLDTPRPVAESILSNGKSILTAFMISSFAMVMPSEVHAGMLTFPLPSNLKNNIVFMRAGESVTDSEGIIETNGAKKLRLSNALTAKGRTQVEQAAQQMIAEGFIPSYIWTSNTERAYETATILSREFQLGQNRVVPEFTFLDARGAGAFEGKPVEAWDEIHRHDVEDGINWRPPQASDGTLSDSAATVLVRGNQLLSTIEGMYSGENVVVVSPDSDVLSILQAAMSDENPDQSLPTHSRFHYNNAEFHRLEPLVKPSTLLVTGQTQEEAKLATRKMKIARIIGDAGKDVKPLLSSWYELWHISVDNY